MPIEPTPEVVQRIADALAAGRKIEAIKIYRDATGADLKDSRDFIEALVPRLKKQDPARFANLTTGGKGCGTALLVLIVMGLAILFAVS